MKMEMSHQLCERILLGIEETKMGGAGGEGGIAISMAMGFSCSSGQLSSVGRPR